MYEDFIPEEYKNELLAIRDRTKNDSWRIGDITNEIIALIEASKLPISKETIYMEVSKYCGRTARTVRYYANIAKFYSPDKREEFDVLSFEHFRIAANRDDWKEMLDDAVDGIEEAGRPRPVEYIAKKYIYEADENCDYDLELMKQINEAIDSLLAMVNKLSISPESKKNLSYAVMQLKEAFESIMVV